MPELTLEALAARIEVLEKKVVAMSGVVPASRDRRSVVGLVDDDPDFAIVIEDGKAIRAADREATQNAPE
jgi:hypothetical protein